jgi:hypothetical protein
MQLSKNAEKLLTAIKQNNLWENKAIEILFPKPQYIGTMDPNFTPQAKIIIQTDYWQWDCNLYGCDTNRPVNGVSTDFKMSTDKSYADITMEAIKELKAAKLIVTKNAGYNTYYYQYTGK